MGEGRAEEVRVAAARVVARVAAMEAAGSEAAVRVAATVVAERVAVAPEAVTVVVAMEVPATVGPMVVVMVVVAMVAVRATVRVASSACAERRYSSLRLDAGCAGAARLANHVIGETIWKRGFGRYAHAAQVAAPGGGGESSTGPETAAATDAAPAKAKRTWPLC